MPWSATLTAPPEASTIAPPRAARLIVVDDHELARAGLRTMLAGERGLLIVGEAADGRAALALCRRLRPDLVLMDVRMPDMDGLTATLAIREELPGIRVIVATMYEDPDYLLRAQQAGAAGYVLKDASRQDLVAVVHRVLRGESLLDQGISAGLLPRLTAARAADAGPPPERLTRRESEILQLLVQGWTNRRIAEHLYISAGTVKIHVERIIAKLAAVDRTHAASRAVALGLCRLAPRP